MPTPRINQPSFAGGILSPSLHGRVDLAKYATGLKDADNMFLHAHGGVSNRAGLEFICETKGSAKCRKLSFDFDADNDETYQLLFTALKMRVVRTGLPVLEVAKSVTAITQASPGVMTSTAHGYSNGDEVVFAGALGMTELNGRNFIVRNVTTNTFTLEDMFGVAVSTTAFPAYGGSATVRRVYEIATPYAEADLPDIDYIQENDVVYLAHENHAPRKLSRLDDDNWTLTTVTFAASIPAPTGFVGTPYFVAQNGNISGFSWVVSAVASGGAESAVSATVSLTDVQYDIEDGQRVRISWTAVSGAVLYNVYRTAGGGALGIVASSATNEVEISTLQWVGDGTSPPGASAPGSPAIPTGVVAELFRGSEISYMVSAISSDNGEESLPSSSVTIRNDLRFQTNKNLLSWSAVTGASSYVVYKLDNGRYGYIGQSETTSFTDRNITTDLSQGPQEASNPFDSAGNYPNCLTFLEQRIFYAGTPNNPSGVWAGQSGNYENFSSASPATARDAITFRIRARQKNRIRAMVPISSGMVVFTSAAEWLVSGGSEDFLTPSNPVIKPQTYRGSTNIKPLLIGSTILFLQARGFVVRDFNYEFTNDNFTGSDLTILSKHLFKRKKPVSWCYAQSPDSIIWLVCDDGSLLSLTYMREHEVWGWTRHSSPGAFFEDVSVVAEGDRDAVYFTVRRTINGQTKRYIERLNDREFDSVEECFFVDCGLTYSGTAATVISNLWHLEGQSVVALADGNVVRGLNVAGGKITLPAAAETVHIGLNYEAFIQTLDIDLGSLQGLGSVQGRPKTVGPVNIRFEKSRGLWIGPDQARLTEWRQRTENFNVAIQLFTGIEEIVPHSDWNKSGSLVLKQKEPLPATILAVMPEIKVGA